MSEIKPSPGGLEIHCGVMVTRESTAIGAASSAPNSPNGCVAGGHDRAIPGTWMRFSSASTASFTTSGALSTSTGSCWTSRCGRGAMVLPPSGSSNACCTVSGMSRSVSSPTACAVMASRVAPFCRRSNTAQAAISTIVLKTHTGRPGVESGRCSGSSPLVKHKSSCPPTP